MVNKSISTTEQLIDNIDILIEKGCYKDFSSFMNIAADLLIKTHKNNIVVDFLHYIFSGVFFFLGCVGATFYLRSLFFYVLTGISGVYLMVFIFLFYDKYKGVKIRHANNN